MIDEKILEQFKDLEPLEKGDFIKVEQYGGGLDESSLLATKRALLYLALESLNAYFGKKGSFSLYDFNHDDTVAGIHSIEVAPARPIKVSVSVRQRATQIAIMLVLLFIVLSTLVGAVNIVGWLWKMWIGQ